MSSNKKNTDKDLSNRVDKLLGNDAKKPTDDELAQRFNKIFSSEPIANQKNPSYHIPGNAYSDDIDKEIEKMLQDSDDEDDAINDYIYSVLEESTSTTSPQDAKTQSIQEKMDGFNKIFLGSQNDPVSTDETDALIKRLQQENALDAKYEQFSKSRDQDMEERYKALRKDAPNFSGSAYSSSGDRPRGPVPKPLQKDDLHDEMDDWCCICNEDAVIECEGCDEEDNKYCKECFFHTHKSEFADYEATKHKSKRYQK